MKKAIIIALLIAQANSMSFYDVFAPVEDSLGRLVSDVVTDIKDTIDCTILAVEHVFSLGGIFGGKSDYDEKCKGQSPNNDVETEDDSLTDDTYPTDNTYSTDDTDSTDGDDHGSPEEDKPPNTTIKKVITDEIQESVSEASQRIHDILDHSDAHLKIENVKISIKNETDRLVQINALLRRELEKLPDEVRQKFNFNYDQPSVQDLFDEVKLLYQVEQRDKSSAEANEVRRMFDKVLDVLHVNDIDGSLSDEDEVKMILKNLGKSTNESLIDIEKQVSLWTEEEEQEISDIKNVVISTNNITQPGSEFNNNKNSSENILLTEKLNEIETQEARMIDFSKSLKNITKSILDKVNEMDLPQRSNIQNSTTNSIPSKDINEYEQTTHSTTKELLTDTLSVSFESSPMILKSSKEVTSSTKARIDFTESSVSSVSPQNIEQTTVVTTKLSTSTETVSITSGSWPSTPTLTPNLQQTSTSQSSNDFSKSTSQGFEVTDTTAVSQILETTIPTVQLVQTTDQENIPTTHIPPTITKDSSGLGQPQILNTQSIITATQMSSDTSVPPQITATSVSTLQSNIQTVNTATQAPVSNAQASPLMQSSLLESNNASAVTYPSRLNADVHKLASVPNYLQQKNYASITPSSQPPMQTSNVQNKGPETLTPSTSNINASPIRGSLSPLITQTKPLPSGVQKYPTYPSSGLYPANVPANPLVAIPSAPGSQSYPHMFGPPAPTLNTKQSLKLSSPLYAPTNPSMASPSVSGHQTYTSSGLPSSPNAQNNQSVARPSFPAQQPRGASPPNSQTFPSLAHLPVPGSQTHPFSNAQTNPSMARPSATGSQNFPSYPSMGRSVPGAPPYPPSVRYSPPNSQAYPSMARPSVPGQQTYPPSERSSPPNSQSYPSMGHSVPGAQPYPPAGRYSPPNSQVYPSMAHPFVPGQPTYPPSGRSSPPNSQTYPSMGRSVPGPQLYPPAGRYSPPNSQMYPSIARPSIPGQQTYPPSGRSSPPNSQTYPPMGRSVPGAQPYPPSRRSSPPNPQTYPSMGRSVPGAQPYPPSGRSSPPNPQTYPSIGRSVPGAQPYPPSGRSSPSNPQAYPSMARPSVPGQQTYPPSGHSSPPNSQAYPSMGRSVPGSQPYPSSGRSSPSNPQAYPSMARPSIPGQQPYPPSGHSSPPNPQTYPPMGRSVPGAQAYPSAAYPKSSPLPARVPPYQSKYAQPHQFNAPPSPKYSSGAYPSQSNPLANRTPQTWGR